MSAQAPSLSWVLLKIAAWYMASVVTVMTSKLYMSRLEAPFFLCLSQFGTSALMAYLVQVRTRDLRPMGFFDGANLARVGVFFGFGFIFTNLSIHLSDPSFAETVKSGEPISTVLCAWLMLKQPINLFDWFCILIIVMGVGLSSAESVQFSWAGVITAVVANVSFSLRGVFVKWIQPTVRTMADSVALFYRVSQIGVLMVLPLVLLMEWEGLAERLSAMATQDLLTTAGLAALNGLCFYSYNQISYQLLNEITFVMHGTLNVFRRVVIVVISCIAMGLPFTLNNVVGTLLAAGGLQLYMMKRSLRLAPSKGTPAPPEPESALAGAAAAAGGKREETA